MWFEARKQERKIRSAMVDHRRRQERRRNFYERIRKDPTEFMQLHGRQSKIYMDPSIAQAAESAAILRQWQGDPQVLIDRFDARSHLDTITEYNPENEGETTTMSSEEKLQERRANFERYRILVLNDFEKTTEEKFLKQIHAHEYFGGLTPHEEKKKKPLEQKAAIAYTYEDSTGPTTSSDMKSGKGASDDENGEDDEETDEEELADELLQITERRVDISTLSKEQCKELNELAINYSIGLGDFTKYMWEDNEEEHYLQQLRDLEQEKANLSGKQSRRQRKLLKEVRVRQRGLYDRSTGGFGLIKPLRNRRRSTSAHRLKSENSSDGDSDSNSSRNSSPEAGKNKSTEKIEYITSFGGKKEADRSIVEYEYKPNSDLKSPTSSTSSRSPKRSQIKRLQRDERDNKSRSRSKDRHGSSSRYRNERHNCSTTKRKRHRSSSSSSSDRGQRRIKKSSPYQESVSKKFTNRGIEERKERLSDDSDSESELSMMSVRSSMSESEQERRQVENTKRRLKNTKRKLRSGAKPQHDSNGSPKFIGAKEKKLTLRERLALQTQKALKKTVAKDKEEESKRREELLREQMEREDEMREMTNIIRQKEREKRDREVEEEMKAAKELSANRRSGSKKRSRSSSSSGDRHRHRRHRSRSHHRDRRSRSRSRSRSRTRDDKRRSRRRSGERSRHEKSSRRRSRSRSRSRDRNHGSSRKGSSRDKQDNEKHSFIITSAKKLVDY